MISFTDLKQKSNLVMRKEREKEEKTNDRNGLLREKSLDITLDVTCSLPAFVCVCVSFSPCRSLCYR